MTEPRDTSALRALLDAEEWGDNYARLRAFAASRCRSDALGEDLAHEAMARAFAPDCSWDPTKEPKVLRWMMSQVNSMLANERSSHRVQRNVSIDRVGEAVGRVRDDAALADEALSREQIATRRVALLRARLADDADATRALDLALDGVDAPAEVARVTGWTPKAVAAARLRMHRHAAKVARDVGGDDVVAVPRDDDEEEVA